MRATTWASVPGSTQILTLPAITTPGRFSRDCAAVPAPLTTAAIARWTKARCFGSRPSDAGAGSCGRRTSRGTIFAPDPIRAAITASWSGFTSM